ncbi:MAG: hypothetical protein COB53_05140 [Elusimicrobia bacterium]|nr:MAG: hypothetical protein COB53_05140 [Elusimicrobiota bacterium]
MWGILLVLAASIASAHDKKLDDYGCHTQFNRGEYHCHSGEFRDSVWKSRKKGRAVMDSHWNSVDELERAIEETGRGVKASCAPMDARGEGRGRVWFGWRWNGLDCIGVKGSRCEGRDCRPLYKGRDTCERDRYHCPTSTSYYRRLKKSCGKLDGCCRRSVRLMQSIGVRQILEDGCPEGYVNEKLSCETKLSWCAPPPNSLSNSSH